MSLASAVVLLQTALSLLTLVNANPSLPQSMRDNAQQVAQQAITQATAVIYQSKPSSGSGTVTGVTPTPPSHPSVSASGSGVAGQNTGEVNEQDIIIGTGETAIPGSNVSVTYVGKLQDGTVFDSSAKHDNQPLTFVLGAERAMTPGFQIGVVGMKVGGERLITIPPPLGYGDQDVKDSTGKVVIPANSTLVFDIKLVQVLAYRTSPYNTAKYWYPPSCAAWQSLNKAYLVAFPTLEALLAQYPGRSESPECL